MNIELVEWGDGTTRLAFWDTLHGKDRIFIVTATGETFEEDDNDVRQPVNLAAELYRMVHTPG